MSKGKFVPQVFNSFNAIVNRRQLHILQEGVTLSHMFLIVPVVDHGKLRILQAGESLSYKFSIVPIIDRRKLRICGQREICDV